MVAPTVQPTIPGTISIVTIYLILAGTPEQQQATIDAIIMYLLAFLQAIENLNVSVTTAPEPIDVGRRQLPALAPVGAKTLLHAYGHREDDHLNRHLHEQGGAGDDQLLALRGLQAETIQGAYCTPDVPQTETNIDLRGYQDTDEVQNILNGIMNGTITLNSLDENGAPTKVQNTICYAEARSSLVPPTAPLDDNPKTKPNTTMATLSPGVLALIVLTGVAVLMIGAILVVRSRRKAASGPPRVSAADDTSP